MILLLCWVFPAYLTDTGIVRASFKRAISMRDEGEVKREKKNNRLSNGILQVICIFHRQKIWLGCKFDNFKWQRQLASTYSSLSAPTTTFPCPGQGLQPIQRLQLQLLLQFMHSSGSTTADDDDEAAAALVSCIWYLVSFICRMHFAVVLIVKCISVLFLSRAARGALLCRANYKQNVYSYYFKECSSLSILLSSKGFEKHWKYTYLLHIYNELILLRVWLKQFKPVFPIWNILIDSLFHCCNSPGRVATPFSANAISRIPPSSFILIFRILFTHT